MKDIEIKYEIDSIKKVSLVSKLAGLSSTGVKFE